MKNLAWTFVFTAGFLFLIPIIAHLFWGCTYSPTEYATFVGGTAGPLAALAGFLFVYINFQQQQEQIKKHDEQFQNQFFDQTFFNLLDYYRESIKNYKIKYLNDWLTMLQFKEIVHDELGLIKKRTLTVNTDAFTSFSAGQQFRDYFDDQKRPISELIKPVLYIVDHICSAGSTNKARYMEILQAQIPDSHFYVYFYFYIAYCLTDFTDRQRTLAYEFFNNGNPSILADPSQLEWIQEHPYNPNDPPLV